MKNYQLFCNKMKKLYSECNSILVENIINEYKDNFDSDNIVKQEKNIIKDNFSFKFIIINQKLPKRTSCKNHFNYCMQNKYCSYLFIDHSEEHFSILLSNSDTLKEEETEFSNWVDFFNKNNVDVIFEKLLHLLEERI